MATRGKVHTAVGKPCAAGPARNACSSFAKTATGALSPKDALTEASNRCKEIFAKWRKKGMVAGGSKDR